MRQHSWAFGRTDASVLLGLMMAYEFVSSSAVLAAALV